VLERALYFNMLKKYFLYLILFLSCISWAKAQQGNDDLIQFSGLVITHDSLRALPLVTIKIKGTNKGTYSDQSGFFSFVARKNDVITFSSIGLKPVEYRIPLSLDASKYSIIQPMSEDTFFLPETVVRPWPTPEEFNYYFVKANIPDEAYEVARGNLRKQALNNISAGMNFDGIEATKYTIQDQNRRYYYNGQLAPNRIFDPFAWGQFFNAWKRGDYKQK
jgi:hypothetical protein